MPHPTDHAASDAEATRMSERPARTESDSAHKRVCGCSGCDDHCPGKNKSGVHEARRCRGTGGEVHVRGVRASTVSLPVTPIQESNKIDPAVEAHPGDR